MTAHQDQGSRKLAPEERIQLIKRVLEDHVSVAQACREFGISRFTFYKWLHRYQKGPKRALADQSDRRPRGRYHWRHPSFRLILHILKIVREHPEYSSRRIARVLEEINSSRIISQHGVHTTLERLGLTRFEDRIAYTGRLAKRDRGEITQLAPQDRFSAIRKNLDEGWNVSDVCRAYGLSRHTFYKWLQRFKQDGFGESLSALIDRRPSGNKHWKSIDTITAQRIIAGALSQPTLSARQIARKLGNISQHGVHNILYRNGLHTFERRAAQAQARRGYLEPKTEEGPVTGWSQRPKQVFKEYIPGLLPAPPPKAFAFRPAGPPPGLRPSGPAASFFRQLPRLSISIFLSLFLLFGIFAWGRLIGSAENLIQALGWLFATSALLMGSLFFIYSLKYYFTLAVVLSFSRENNEEETPLRQGYEGQARNIERGIRTFSQRSSWTSWLGKLFGIARITEQKGLITASQFDRAGGLEPDLTHITLERRPFISVHLPMFNEKQVVERILRASTSFDYDRYEVIVADDSTDETTAIVRQFADQWNDSLKTQNLKPVIKVIHRDTREGFKGGALKEALKHTDPRAEFIVVFDADFVPYPDTLELFLKYFQVNAGSLDFVKQNHELRRMNYGNINHDSSFMLHDSCRIAAIQGYQWPSFAKATAGKHVHGYQDSNVAAIQGYQWHVLNKSENWITRGVRSEYAGSYVIERSGAELYGGLKQIAGSVYMIRRDLLDRFGWGTSITEDFQLTLKLYEQGYKVIYTPYIQAPAECASTLKRLIRQRMRWAEGHSFNIRKMFLRLITTTQLSLPEKLEFLYLSPYYLQAAFFLLGTISWLFSETLFKARLPFWTNVWGWSLVLTNLLSLPLMNTVGLFLEEAEEKDFSGTFSFILLSYLLVPFQAYASIKGFLESQEGPWFRTPKTGKITDILTRGRFYRFLRGIFPRATPAFSWVGGRHSSARWLWPVSLRPAVQLGSSLEPILTSRRRRWLGRGVVAFVLLFSMTLLSVAPLISTSNAVQASEQPKLQTIADLKERGNLPSASASEAVTAQEFSSPRMITTPIGDGELLAYIFHREPKIEISVDGYSLTFTTTTIGGMSVHPRRSTIVADRVVTYEEIIEGVDLRYTVGRTGITEEFILNEPASVQPFLEGPIEQTVKLDGLEAVTATDQTIRFVSQRGEMKELLRFDAPLARDANGLETHELRLAYREARSGGSLVKVLDAAAMQWLLAPERSFPISIDPSVVLTGTFSETEANRGGQQRKVVYANGNWYAFYDDATDVFYKKSSDGTSWDPAVDIDTTDADNRVPSIWLEGSLIYVAWIDDTTDNIEVNTINTASSDAPGTKCTSADLGTFSPSSSASDYPVIAVADNGMVYTAVGGTTAVVLKLTFSGCTFADISSGSVLTTFTVPTLTTIGNNLQIVYQEGGGLAHAVYNGTNWTAVSRSMTELQTGQGGQQRKIVYANGNWYAFSVNATTVFFRKSSDGSTWGNTVAIDTANGPMHPTAWVEGTTIYVAWIRDTGDAIAVNTINTASSDALSTQCTSGDLGFFANNIASDFPSLAVADNGTVYVAVGGNDAAAVRVYKLTFSGCTFADITSSSGLTANGVPTLTTIGNNLHMVYQDGAGLAHAVSDGTSWVAFSKSLTELQAGQGGQQRKVVYANGNWYAFSVTSADLFYRKSSDGSSWGDVVFVSTVNRPIRPTAWVEGTTIYVGWIRDTGDAFAVNTIDTANSDQLGTQCTSGDLGFFAANQANDFPALAVADNGTVYIATGAIGSNPPALQKLTYSGCTFADIIAGSGLTIGDVPTLTTIGNNLHMVFQDAAGLAHAVYDGTSWITLSKTLTESQALQGGQQRKIVYANGNWYAFSENNTSVFYRKSSDGVSWGNTIVIDATNDPFAPTAWVEGTTIYVAWIRDTNDGFAVNTIDTASSDVLGTQCTSGDLGFFARGQSGDFPALAVADDGTVYVATGAIGANPAALRKLTYSGCTFADIITGSGLTTGDLPTVTTIGNNLHMVFQDGNLSHSVYDGSSWTTSNTTIDSDTDNVYSLTTDGSSLWLLTVDSTTATAFYVYSGSWSSSTAPWTSETNLTSVSLTYDSSNTDLYAMVIKDTSEQAYYKSTDITSISWSGETSFGFTAGDLGHISSPQEGAGTSQIGAVVREVGKFRFSNLTPSQSTIIGDIEADTTDTVFSLTTDATNLWLLTVDDSASTAFYKCSSCASGSSWSSQTSPWTGQTNLTSATITYDSSNTDLYAMVIKDTSEQAYYKSTDITSISWSGETSFGFTAGDLGHISSPQEGAGTSQIAVTLREADSYKFASLSAFVSWVLGSVENDTNDTVFSLTTDGTNLWLLTVDDSASTAFYKCSSCASGSSWSSQTSPWTGQTNLTSATITYDSSNTDLYAMVIKDTSEQAYYKSTDITSISWSGETSFGFTAGDLGHISSPQEGAGTSQIGAVVREVGKFRFSNLTPSQSTIIGDIEADTTDTVFSLTTDATNLWLLTVDSTSATAFYKCTSCASSSTWTTETSPWPSGETNLTSVTLTYDSTNTDLYAMVIMDTSEQAYFKNTDTSSISWTGETSFGFTPGDMGHISSPQEGAGISQIGVTLRQGTNYEFAIVVPEYLWLWFGLAPFLPLVLKRKGLLNY